MQTAEDEDWAPEAGPGNGSQLVRGLLWQPGGQGALVTDWQLPEEEPVAVVYNRRAYAVMLCSPADLADFGIGFSLAEGIVSRAAEIDDLQIERQDAGLVVRMTIPASRAAALVGRRRALEGRSGCGLCGLDSLEALQRPLPQVQSPDIQPEAIAAAFTSFYQHQPMRSINHSVHAAGWCDKMGQILLCREDVGRHTALDKLIGAMHRTGIDGRDGFALLSSRCGYELVQKAAAVGIGLLASVSAPTVRAQTLAAASGMTLAVSVRGAGIMFPGQNFVGAGQSAL